MNASAFNRTIVELKLIAVKIAFLNVTRLLIEPLWN